jgi:stalled ribosome rescue protein Dom34
MTTHYHAVVWMDHQHARILSFSADACEPADVHTNLAGHHLQHKANIHGSGHRSVDKDYFTRIVRSIGDAGAVLLCGPGTAKVEFKHFLDDQVPALNERIAAVETVDHPSDGMLLALGRKFFKSDDRMHAPAA